MNSWSNPYMRMGIYINYISQKVLYGTILMVCWVGNAAVLTEFDLTRSDDLVFLIY
jgi:hypothetical protein